MFSHLVQNTMESGILAKLEGIKLASDSISIKKLMIRSLTSSLFLEQTKKYEKM